MISLKRRITMAVVAAFLAAPAEAQIANYANVSGLSTFQDLYTGRVWLDLNNFYGLNTTQMLSTASAAGFAFATTADLTQLFLDAPNVPANYAAYAAIIGSAPSRSLFWGSYDSGNGSTIGWAYADNGTNWNFSPTATNYGSVSGGNGDPYQDMNVFAYQEATAAPEPASMVLLATGLAGIAAVARRRRAAV